MRESYNYKGRAPVTALKATRGCWCLRQGSPMSPTSRHPAAGWGCKWILLVAVWQAQGFDCMVYLSIISDAGLIVGKLQSVVLQH